MEERQTHKVAKDKQHLGPLHCCLQSSLQLFKCYFCSLQRKQKLAGGRRNGKKERENSRMKFISYAYPALIPARCLAWSSSNFSEKCYQWPWFPDGRIKAQKDEAVPLGPHSYWTVVLSLNERLISRTGEMAQPSRALASPVGEPGLLSRTHVVAHNQCNSTPALLWPSWIPGTRAVLTDKCK